MRLLWVGAILCLCCTCALSQDFPKAEIFAGYSYANMPILAERSSANGWGASATVNIYRWFGLTSDFNGLYGLKGSETLGVVPIPITEQIKENFHSFMFGPQVSYRMARIVPFAHLLVGESRVGQTVRQSFSPTGFTLGGLVLQRATTTATAALGIGFDCVFTRRLAWRVQADSLMTVGSAANARLATGIVFRIGK
jgi:hypothetical protein